jgi:hypothetical protein
LNQADIDPNDVFYATRRGERVTIRWDADFSGCKGIRIFRNAVDTPANSRLVADLPASSTEYADTVPNARIFWYWLAIDIDGVQVKRIGPVRARADIGKATQYASAAKDITLVARRTQSSVVVAWDLPKGNYKDIAIRRRNKPELPYGLDQRAQLIVHSTNERSGDLVDALPNPNNDFWYWLEVTKEDGSVITKGPAKARFEALDMPQGQPKAAPKKNQPKKSLPKKNKYKGKTKG